MRIRHAVGVLLVGAVALVGCGGSDDNTASTATTVKSTATTTSAGGVTQARCAEAATAMAQAATDIPLALSGTTESLRNSVDKFKTFASSAPSEIRDDLQTIAGGYDDFVQVLADANITPASGQTPTAEDAAKIQAAADALGTPSFKAATARVQAWFTANCAG
ncbi:MAG: hypothetical protein QOG43_2813 [Actinomycetota bacterium]|jgi:hypothetical protein|nr:hypothetical protein [Actinomycetota bacterium]